MKTSPFISGVRAILVGVLFSACSDDVQVPNEQQVYFEVNYANQAWGNQFKGFLIDKDGRILTYDKPAKWIAAEATAMLSSGQLEANLSQTIVSGQQIGAADLDKFATKAKQISDAAFSKPVNGGVDLGLTRFYSYHFDAATKTYRLKLLRQTGNVVIHNTDSHAEDVADWLVKVVDDVY